MARILVLPETIASRIAAGEVVERPASALKELIENSIDAGSRTIEISLESGGRDALVVTDDGEGMGPDDLLLSLERHATSKIRSDSDIEQVRTLGFRGEAVPAIASVSRFRMSSRDAASDVATVVEVHAGRLVGVTQEAAPKGTRVEVRSLFYNAPARRKFLRSADTERQRAAEVVSRFAIGYPGIRFRLRADDRLVFDHAPVASPLERCAQVFGRQMTDSLMPLAAASGLLGLTGLCSGISETRSHTRDQHVYVNRRPVRDRLLAHAISAAYAEALPPGRSPVVILLLEVPPELVDVNVHPTKSEVRFRKPSEVHDFLVSSLQRILRQAGSTPNVSLETAFHEGSGRFDPTRFPGGGTGDARTAEPYPSRLDAGGEPHLTSELDARSTAHEPRLPGSSGFTYSPERFGRGSGAGAWPSQGEPEDWLASRPDEVSQREPAPHSASAVPLGQFLDSYILAAEGGALLLIDQHAAHERVLFEKLTRDRGTRPVSTQRLLVPVPVELAPGDREETAGWVEALNGAGFEAEGFGEGVLLLRGVPAGFDVVDPEALVRDVLSDLRGVRAISASDERVRRVAASVACHAAIKVHFPLTATKMAWLVTELFRCDTPTTCPHGRPAVLRIGREQIERGFHRR